MLDSRAEDGLPSYQHQVQQKISWNESLEAFQQPEETQKHFLNSLGWVTYVPHIYANKEIVIKMDIM